MKTLSLVLAIGAVVSFTAAKLVSRWWNYQRGVDKGRAEGFQRGYREGHKDAEQFAAGLSEDVLEKLWNDSE